MALTTDALAGADRASRRRVLIDLAAPGVVIDLGAVEAAATLGPPANRWARYGKRVADALGASLLILLTAPLFVVLVLAVRCSSRGPALYVHDRVGRNGRAFKCLKFRTMVDDADARLAALLANDESARDEFTATCKIKHDPRVTRVGRFLRRTSLDEVPQLWNVLAGDMSLVGPRPLLPVEPDRYGKDLPAVLSVRPGMTGPWQVGGRNDLPYDERVVLQASYRDHCSFLGDTRIVLRTVPAMFRRDNGAY